MKKPVLLLFSFVSLVLVSCGGGNGGTTTHPTTPPPPQTVSVSVSPSFAMVPGGATQQFTATVQNTSNQAVTWGVSGPGCSGPSCGTIEATGKYTAPATPPNPGTVTVTATSVADPLKLATASVTITSGNSVSTINSLFPSATAVGGPAFALKVVGSNFVSSSVVQWNGSDRPTAFNDSTQITAEIPASDIAATGTATVTVLGPGGTSNSLTFGIVTGLYPASVAVAPDPSGKFGKFAYAANAGSNNVSMYTIDPTTGALTFTGTVAAGANPSSVAVHASGKFAYVANGGSNNISMYTIDLATGALTSLGTISSGTGPASVTVDPSGKFAYAANAGSNNVSMYTIDPTTGALTSTGTVAAGTNPSSVAVHASGKFAYVANGGSNNISMFAIDPTTGALTSTGTVDAGTVPSSLAVHASGKFAYVGNCGDYWGYDGSPFGDISIYTIDFTTGALTSIGATDSGAGTICPAAVAVHPGGKFAYAANADSNNISMYTIDPTTGALTSTGTIAAGTNPASVTVDPSGKFAYVANTGSSNISMYSIDAATGALTLIGSIGT